MRQGYAPHRSTIDDKLRLLTLPEAIQQSIIEGRLDISKGYELAKVEDEKSQRVLFDKAVAKDMSVRKLKREVRSRNVRRKREKEGTSPPVEIPQGDIPGVFFKDSSDMSEIKDETVALILTSPGYCVGMEYEKSVTLKDHLKNLKRHCKEWNRVLIKGGIVAVNFGDIRNFRTQNGGKVEIQLMGHYYQAFLRKHNIRLRDIITWRKGKTWINNPQVSYHDKTKHTSYRILNNFEYIYVFYKEGKREVPFDIECESKISKDEWKEWVDGVWEIPPVRRQKGHPAQFPEEIPRRLIRMYSYKGDIVLDCFGGSMTTVKVANELGRIGIGYEKEEKYNPVIMEKLGLTEEDLKKPEPVLEQKGNRFGFIDQFQSVIAEIISTDGKSAGDIMSVRVPVKDEITKEDITIEHNIDGETPDPSGSPSPPQICRPDDYDEAQAKGSNLGIPNTEMPHLLPEKCAVTSPYLNKVILGDCLDKLKDIPDNSVDLIVTDPPYGLKYMDKDWDRAIPSIEIWREALRVLKPGSTSFIMSLPRQDLQSRMIASLEEAGFSINFSPIYWTYTNGFGKGHDMKKALSRRFGVEAATYRQLEGSYKSFQPRPALEVILTAMKPLDERTYWEQALKNGKGITWLEDCRIPCADRNNAGDKGRLPANLLISDNVLDDGRRRAHGLSFSDFFSLDNWADKNLKNFPFLIVPKPSKKEKEAGLDDFPEKTVDDGRKKPIDNPFQRGKTKRKNTHPTTKPIKLMCYLITMGSREGDLVLDPFCGSGSTCVATKYLKRDFIGIEIEEEYQKISEAKVKHAALSMAA